MFTIFLNKAKALLDVQALSLLHSIEKEDLFDQNKMKWQMVMLTVKTDFNTMVSLLKQNELKLADAQASGASWQNKAILALSQGLIELAKNAFIHKSYYDSYVKELLTEKEVLVNQMNVKKAELFKITFRINQIHMKSKNKYMSSEKINGLVYKPGLFSFSSERIIGNIRMMNCTSAVFNYSHMMCQFD